MLRGVATNESLGHVLADIEDSGWEFDVVVVTGDVGQDHTPGAYRRFVGHLKKLDRPVLCVPGNHDDRDLMRQFLEQPPFGYCETLRIGGWSLIGIDSCTEDTAAGKISGAELQRLEDELDAARGSHALIALHHPPLSMQSLWLDRVGLHNSAQFLSVLDNGGNVRGALFGHVHQNFDARHGDIRIIGTPSTCRQFLPRAAEFATDDRAPAWRRITLMPDGEIEDELVWLN